MKPYGATALGQVFPHVAFMSLMPLSIFTDDTVTIIWFLSKILSWVLF